MQETWVRFLGQEDPLEKEMATHSSILAWEIPWTEAWWATVQIVTKSQTQLSKYTTTTILTHPFIHFLTSLSKVHEF